MSLLSEKIPIETNGKEVEGKCRSLEMSFTPAFLTNLHLMSHFGFETYIHKYILRDRSNTKIK